MKIIVTAGLLIFFALIPSGIFSQRRSNLAPGSNLGKIEVAVLVGVTYSGAMKNMLDHMEEVNLDQDRHVGPTFYDYPFQEVKLGRYNIDIRYRINKKSGISLNGGSLSHFIIKGYNPIGEGVYLILGTKIHSIAGEYVYYGNSRRSTFSVGPVFYFINVEAFQAFNPSSFFNTVKPGITASYSFKLLDLKSFFISLSASGSWAIPTKIGPFKALERRVVPDQQYFIRYDPKNIGLGTIGIGLNAGFRI